MGKATANVTERARADKGDGSIYQTKDGNWRGKLKPEGSNKTKYFFGKTRADVKNRMKEFRREAEKYGYIGSQKRCVRDFMDDWLYNIKYYELKPKSFDRLECTLQNQVYKHIGEVHFSQLTSADIQNLIHQLVDEGLSYSSIKKTYESLNACFKWGMSQEPPRVVKNPCVGVSLPEKAKKQNKKSESNKVRYFNDEEVDLIYRNSTAEYSDGKPIYRLGYSVIVLLHTGLRIGEFAGLKWENVNFAKKMITVSESTVVVKNRDKDGKAVESGSRMTVLRQDDVKTERGERTVPLSKKAVDAFLELKKITGDYEYVLTTGNGNPYLPISFDSMFRKILLRSGIKPCGVHVCRHTFASMLFKKGVDVKTVSELLGHADVSTTYNIYIHLIEEQKREAINILDDL
jgi:integrase